MIQYLKRLFSQWSALVREHRHWCNDDHQCSYKVYPWYCRGTDCADKQYISCGTPTPKGDLI